MQNRVYREDKAAEVTAKLARAVRLRSYPGGHCELLHRTHDRNMVDRKSVGSSGHKIDV